MPWPRTARPITAAPPRTPSPAGAGSSPPALCFPGSPPRGGEAQPYVWKPALPVGGHVGQERHPRPPICQIRFCPKCPPPLSAPPQAPQSKPTHHPSGMGHLQWLCLGVTSAPISPSRPGGDQGRHAGLSTGISAHTPTPHPRPTLSNRPSAFTQCWFYNKMGTFFFINEGSLHSSWLPSLWLPFRLSK